MAWVEFHFGSKPDQSPTPVPAQDSPAKSANAGELLRDQIRAFAGPYERYHESKENRAYIAAAAYIGATIGLITWKNPLWNQWTGPAFGFLCLFVLTLSIVMLRFVWWQLENRRYAADIFQAFVNVFSASLTPAYGASDLKSINTDNLPKEEKWPAAIALEYERLICKTHKWYWEPRLLTLLAMVITLVALLRHLVSFVL